MFALSKDARRCDGVIGGERARNIEAVRHAAEDGVLSIEFIERREEDHELGACRVRRRYLARAGCRTLLCHDEPTRKRRTTIRAIALVGNRPASRRLSTRRAFCGRWITALDAETAQDPMERCAVVVSRLHVFDEVADGVWGLLLEEFDLDRAL